MLPAWTTPAHAARCSAHDPGVVPGTVPRARTNNKVSTAKSKVDILRKHLIPAFGHLKLDQIDTARI
ncbi:hypothetical protein D7Y21_16100 [Corallococcus sp. AB045]|uniref:N-terminal phage integrase SAM-like domain-containing protein n=1 Tax=Corallococcus sp. AB045 TaxID=2316719 RepID=UPI000EE135C0|nr:hypothetical protein D7Y21_16100 [Corallococcus sp. AB045]